MANRPRKPLKKKNRNYQLEVQPRRSAPALPKRKKVAGRSALVRRATGLKRRRSPAF